MGKQQFGGRADPEDFEEFEDVERLETEGPKLSVVKPPAKVATISDVRKKDFGPLPDYVFEDLRRSGLTDETIKIMRVLPLTPESFKTYFNESLISKKTRGRRFNEGYLIPYHGVNGSYARLKVLDKDKNETGLKYYAAKGSSSHLYILPDDKEKLNSPKTILVFTEGEKKGAALSQYFRSLDNGVKKYAPLAASGVYQFLTSPELHKIRLQDLHVYFCLDADSGSNPDIIKAEYQLLSYCLSRKIPFDGMKSLFWDIKKGKGIDDYLQYKKQQGEDPVDVLQHLLDTAKNPFEKYGTTITLSSSSKALATTTTLNKEHVSVLTHELHKVYKPNGIKKGDVNSVLKGRLEVSRQQKIEKDVEKNGEVLKQRFDLDYDPAFPSDFGVEDWFLTYLPKENRKLCNLFFVKEILETEKPEDDNIYRLTFHDDTTGKVKNLDVAGSSLSSTDELAVIFTNNAMPINKRYASYIQEYVTGYCAENQQRITKQTLLNRVGWDPSNTVFRLPQYDINTLYDPYYTNLFYTAGTLEQQNEFIKNKVLSRKAGFFILLSLATPLMTMFHMQPFVISAFGRPGTGKTTALKAALSLWGDPKKLKFSLNSTDVADERTLSSFRDVPVVFDEVDTAGRHAKGIGDHVRRLVFDFVGQTGRRRGSKTGGLQDIVEYRSFLSISSNKTIKAILQESSSPLSVGVYRRVLEVPVLYENALWGNDVDYNETHAVLDSCFGFVGMEWLKYISQGNVFARLQDEFSKQRQSLRTEWGYSLQGKEELLALLLTVYNEMFYFWDADHFTRIEEFIHEIAAYNQVLHDEQVRENTEQFVQQFTGFLSSYAGNFYGMLPDNRDYKTLWGKVKVEGDPMTVYITPKAFERFCRECYFPQEQLEHYLLKENIWEKPGGRKVKQVRLLPNSIRTSVMEFKILADPVDED